jgi:GT2 family glycosyltransferase
MRQKPRGPQGTLIDITLPIFGEFGLAVTAIEKVKEAAAPLSPEKYRLIVLDNGTPPWVSHEGDVEVTPEEQAAEVKELLRPNHDLFIRVDQNIGYPGGMNECASHGRSPLILILTADVFLEPGAINNMVMVMDNPDVGVVGCKLLFPLDMESPHGPGGTVQHAGLAFGIQGKPYHIFIGWSPDNPRVNVRRDMAAVTGACFMTRRNLWQEIGGFDTRYGLGTFEDIDYCFSIRSMGKKVMFEPTAVGYHLVSGAKLQGANQTGFNLPMNETIFRGKWAHMLAWDEWRYL